MYTVQRLLSAHPSMPFALKALTDAMYRSQQNIVPFKTVANLLELTLVFYTCSRPCKNANKPFLNLLHLPFWICGVRYLLIWLSFCHKVSVLKCQNPKLRSETLFSNTHKCWEIKKNYNINPAADFQCIFVLFCLCISNLFFELRGGTSAPFSLLKTSVFSS